MNASLSLFVFDLLMLSTLLGLAIATLSSRDQRRAAILFIAFGLWLALVWARLGAPDVALAEAAIGAGLGGALMLAAARRWVDTKAPAPLKSAPTEPAESLTPAPAELDSEVMETPIRDPGEEAPDADRVEPTPDAQPEADRPDRSPRA